MSGRLISATAHRAFLGIAAVFAGDLVDKAMKGRVIAVVFSGLTAATVLGAPIGAAVGRALGWRFTFWTLVVLGGIALIGLVAPLPRNVGAKAPNAAGAHDDEHAHPEARDPHGAHAEAHGGYGNHGHAHSQAGDDVELDAHARMHMAQERHRAPLREQLRAIGRVPVWMGLLMTLLSYGGVFTSYVYLAPQLTEVAGFSGAWVTPLFLLFGVGLFFGNMLGGRLADKSLMPAVLVTVGSLVLMLFVMFFAIQNPVTTVIGVFLYGVAAFSVVARCSSGSSRRRATPPTWPPRRTSRPSPWAAPSASGSAGGP